MTEMTHEERVHEIIHRFFSVAGGSSLLPIESQAEAAPLIKARVTKATRSFSEGQVVFVYDVYWGMNERAKVAARYRRKHRFVRGEIDIESLADARPVIVYDPAVIRALDGRNVDGGIFARMLSVVPDHYKQFAEYRDVVLAHEGAIQA